MKNKLLLIGLIFAIQMIFITNVSASFSNIAATPTSIQQLNVGDTIIYTFKLTPSILSHPTYGFGIQISADSPGGTPQLFHVYINESGVTKAEGYGSPTVWLATDVSWSPDVEKIYTVEIINTGAVNGDYTLWMGAYDGTAPIVDLSFSTTKKNLAFMGVGFSAIPEFPTVALPIAAVIGLVFFFQQKKKKE